MGRKMELAGRAKHMRGIPRRMVFMAVVAVAKAVTTLLNTTTVHNVGTLIRLVRSRPHGVPLITVSNHMSTLDDPHMWGIKGFPTSDAKLARWVLAAEDICFRNSLTFYFFRLGKCIPITRGAGIYQADAPIRRLKWGTASLIARAPITPIVFPIIHRGFEEVYDVSAYLKEHPGGDDVVLAATAKDGTDEFEDAGHSNEARELLKKYCIGEIDTSAPAIPELEIVSKKQSSDYAQKLLDLTKQYWAVPAVVVAISVVVGFLYLRKK